jgi:hypothetical protein
MTSPIQVVTRVLPGNRLEISSPDLKEGESVEVTIRPVAAAVSDKSQPGILDLLESFTPSRRTAEEWEEFDRQFRAERDAWDR